MSDDPTEEQAKKLLMQVVPGAIGTAIIERAMLKPEAGFVLWDAKEHYSEPEAAHFHALTFMQAIYTGLSFCGTDTRDEWCVLGREALIRMRSMPGFKQQEPVVCGHLVYIGSHGSIQVYVEVNTDKPLVAFNGFVMGVGETAARGLINDRRNSCDEPYEDEP